jgi:hypothetical protein
MLACRGVCVIRACVALFSLALYSVADPQEPPPPALAAQDNSVVLHPTASITAEDMKKMAHTGIAVAAKFARVSPQVTAVVEISGGLIELGDAADAVTDAKDLQIKNHLFIISADQNVLRQLKQEGALRAGDPRFDAIRKLLGDEVQSLSYGSSWDFFSKATLSKEGLWIEAKHFGKHYLTSFFGAWLGGKLATWTGIDGPLREVVLEHLAQDRDITRQVWKNADSLSRVLQFVGVQLSKLATQEAATELAKIYSDPNHDGGGGVGPSCVASASSDGIQFPSLGCNNPAIPSLSEPAPATAVSSTNPIISSPPQATATYPSATATVTSSIRALPPAVAGLSVSSPGHPIFSRGNGGNRGGGGGDDQIWHGSPTLEGIRGGNWP